LEIASNALRFRKDARSRIASPPLLIAPQAKSLNYKDPTHPPDALDAKANQNKTYFQTGN